MALRMAARLLRAGLPSSDKALQRLFNARLLKHGHITEQILSDAGQSATAIVKKAQNERLRQRRLSKTLPR